jgi:hypothetical protein
LKRRSKDFSKEPPLPLLEKEGIIPSLDLIPYFSKKLELIPSFSRRGRGGSLQIKYPKFL